MLTALLKTISETKRPYFWKVVISCVVITVIIITVFIWGAGYLLEYLVTQIEFIQNWKEYFTWLDSLGSVAAGVISYFLLPVLFPAISYIFQDHIISNLNKIHLDDKPVSELGLAKSIIAAVKFTLFALFMNLLFLPFYFIPFIGVGIYFFLNAYLLGREYYELVSPSLVGVEKHKSFKKQYSGKLNLMGLIIALSFITPFLNFVAPILSVIFAWFYVKKIQSNKV